MVRRARAFLALLWRGGRWQTLAVGALTLVRGLLPPTIIVATGVLIDAVPDAVESGLTSSPGRRVLWALTAVAVAFLASGVVDALAAFVARAAGSRYAITVHEVVAEAAASPSGIAPLEDPDVAGALAAVDEYDRAGVYRNAIFRLGELATQRVRGLAAFSILLAFAWWTPFILLIGWRLVNRSVALWVEKGVALGHLHTAKGLRRAQYFRSLAVDAPAAKEVRIFGLQDWVVDRYASAWRRAMTEIWSGRKASLPGVLGAAAALAASHAVVFGALGGAALAGEISLGALVIFAQAALSISLLGPLGDTQWEVGRILQSAGQVRELESRLVDAGPHYAPMRRGSVAGPVAARFAGVRFTYRGRNEPTIDGLDLVVPEGQSLAIVGENGAGKTTLIKLLCGLYEPDAGTILIDGRLAPSRARHRIAAIFQEFVRYELPLRENVGFGDIALMDDGRLLEEALVEAGGADLPSLLPAGWDTVLARSYQNGTELSGGQWQKVALARALTAVRGGAGVLILDEPTATLDVRAECELFDRFLEITRGVTTILVSHRMSSVRRADRIVVLADGRVAEDGTHDELLASGGRYATMYRLQAGRFQAEPLDAAGDIRRKVGSVA